tara:strand:+ start:371 stop:646 length:276 start_codon:yes stop_codon:yes gene_type:complete
LVKLLLKKILYKQENKTINCSIKNLDWLNNSTSFEYKLTEDEEENKASIKTVIESEIKSKLYNPSYRTIKYNDTFSKQTWNSLKCSSIKTA